MSLLTEELAGQIRQHRSEDEVYTELLHEAQELTLAMKSFLEGKQQCDAVAEPSPTWKHWHAPHERTLGEQAAAESTDDQAVGIVALLSQLSAALPLCRARRRELSLLLVETNGPNLLTTGDKDATLLLRQTLERACQSHTGGEAHVLSITTVQLAAILPNCERRQAVALANDVIAQMAGVAAREDAPQAVHTATLSAGVATVAHE